MTNRQTFRFPSHRQDEITSDEIDGRTDKWEDGPSDGEKDEKERETEKKNGEQKKDSKEVV